MRDRLSPPPARRLAALAITSLALLAATLIGGDSAPLAAQGTPPRDPPPDITPAPFNDFAVTHFEVTQGLQNLDHDIPLVAGRRTVVRAFVRDLGGLGADAVSARLTARRPSSGGGDGFLVALPPLTPNPLVPSNPNGVIAIDASGGERRNLDDSFWFVIPSAWHANGGTLEFRVEVNPEVEGDLNAITLGQSGVPEANRLNNTRTISVDFHTADPVRLRYVPLHLHPNWDADNNPVIYGCDEPGLPKITAEIFRFVPTASVHYTCLATPLEPFPHEIVPAEIAPYEFNMSDPAQCLFTNARLDWLRSQENWGSNPIYTGTVDSSYSGLCNGWSGAASSGTIWVRMSEGVSLNPYPTTGGGRTLAHEAGHRFGSPHVLCKGNEGPPNGSIDPNYPYPFPDCRFTAFDVNGFYGFDTYSTVWRPTDPPLVLDNGTPGTLNPAAPLFPLMGYLGPRWTSPYTYCGYLNELVNEGGFFCDQDTIDPADGLGGFETAHAPDAAELSPAQFETEILALELTGTVVYVTGIVDLVGPNSGFLQHRVEGKIDVFPHVIERSIDRIRAADTSPLASGVEYTLRVTDTETNALHTRMLVPDLSVHEGFPAFSFGDALPLPPEAHAVRLYHGDELVDEIILSPESSAPKVTLLSPTGGEPYGKDGSKGGNVEVTWKVEEGEAAGPGGPIFTTIQFSPDGGETWQVLALDVPGESFTLPDGFKLPGTRRGLLRVVAQQGGRVARDTSDLLIIPDAAPDAIIVAPSAGDAFAQTGDPIILSGYGLDPEDGLLDNPSSLTWVSNRDGLLGQGELVLGAGLADGLSSGAHTLTLLVSDSAGNTGQAQTEIVVIADDTADAPEYTSEILPGWNLIGWPGETTPVNASVLGYVPQEITAVSLFTFDPQTQQFLSFRPGLPPALNTLTDLHPGDGVWVLSSLLLPAVQRVADTTANGTLILQPGFNLVLWTGADDVPVREALGDILPQVVSLYTWDAVAQQFQSFRPDLPTLLNTATSLSHNQGVWIEVDEITVWPVPAGHRHNINIQDG